MATHGFASALQAAIFPDSCCIYPLHPGISHAAVAVKPAPCDHTAYPWENPNSLITLTS